MNKKILSGLLACVMAFGSVFAVAGCKPDQSGSNQGTQNGQQGGQGGQQGEQSGQGGQQGEQQGGQQGEQGGQGGGQDKDKTIAPGTVITDKAVKNEFFNALSSSELNGFTYSASANLDVRAGETVQAQKIAAEGAVLFSDETVRADLYVSISAAGGEEQESGYYLCFLRGNTAYTASGDWDGEGEVDFSALKSRLKAEKNRLLLDKQTVTNSYLQLAKSKTVYQIVRNLPTLFDGVLTKTEGGYTLTFDVGRSLGTFLASFRPLAQAFDANHDLSLGGLFKEDTVKTTLEKLLKGVTAEELVTTLTPVLPEALSEALPTPAKTETAAVYVDDLLRSGSFFRTLTGEDEAWSKWKTFAEVPLKELLGLVTGEEFTFEPTATERFDELIGKLKTGLIETLMEYAGVEEGELSEEQMQVSMTFAFDEEKHLLGFSADALAGGSKTAGKTTEKEEQSGSSEKENGGEESESEAEQKARQNASKETDGGTQSADGKEEGDTNGGQPQKRTVRGTVKLEAAGASSPELFDLTGCKYQNGEGGAETIRAKK